MEWRELAKRLEADERLESFKGYLDSIRSWVFECDLWTVILEFGKDESVELDSNERVMVTFAVEKLVELGDIGGLRHVITPTSETGIMVFNVRGIPGYGVEVANLEVRRIIEEALGEQSGQS